jgi:hypothetical protein
MPPNHPDGIRMRRIQHNVIFMRNNHGRNPHASELSFRDETVADPPKRSRCRVGSPIAGKRRGRSHSNSLRHFERRDDKVIWHECPINVRKVLKYHERAMGGSVASACTDARPTAPKKKRPLSVEVVRTGELPAGKPVNLHLTDATVRDAA